MNVHNNRFAPSALAFLNKIGEINPDFTEINMALAEDMARKRTLKDIFQSRSFWRGIHDGFTVMKFLFESKTSRNFKDRPRCNEGERYEEPLWRAIGKYCAAHPDILQKIDVNKEEMAKLKSVMPKAAPVHEETHAPHAG